MLPPRFLKYPIAILSLFVVTGTAHAAMLSYDFSSTIINPGESVTAEIVIDGLGAGSAPSLGAYDIELIYDSTLFNAGAVSFGDPVLGNQLDLFGFGFNPSGSDFSTPGNLGLFEVSLDSVADLNNFQASSFILASVVFTSLQPGLGLFDFSINALSDASGDALAATTMSAQVSVVPIPAALPLFLSALAALGFVGWRRRRT